MRIKKRKIRKEKKMAFEKLKSKDLPKDQKSEPKEGFKEELRPNDIPIEDSGKIIIKEK